MATKPDFGASILPYQRVDQGNYVRILWSRQFGSRAFVLWSGDGWKDPTRNLLDLVDIIEAHSLCHVPDTITYAYRSTGCTIASPGLPTDRLFLIAVSYYD